MKNLLLILVVIIGGLVLLGSMGADDNKAKVRTSKVCAKVAQYYLDPEVILNKGSRELGVKVVAAEAVKSDDFENFYFVQYKMNTPSNGIVYPMFAMNKPFEVGVTIYALDDLAIALSGLADGRRTKAKFSSSDDGYYEASRCLKS